jgi:hypothetical protein
VTADTISERQEIDRDRDREEQQKRERRTTRRWRNKGSEKPGSITCSYGYR